jgi:hypothetical protein
VDLDKLSAGDKVILASAGALFVFSFVPWFGFEHEFSRNAWHYSFFGVVPLALAAVMLAAVVVRLVGMPPRLAVSSRRALFTAGCLALVLIALKTLLGDRIDVLSQVVHLERKFGLYMSLVSALGLALGGFLVVREPRISE